jgi:hypothetical protein
LKFEAITLPAGNFSKSAGVYAEGWVLERRGHPQSTRLK